MIYEISLTPLVSKLFHYSGYMLGPQELGWVWQVPGEREGRPQGSIEGILHTAFSTGVLLWVEF